MHFILVSTFHSLHQIFQIFSEQIFFIVTITDFGSQLARQLSQHVGLVKSFLVWTASLEREVVLLIHYHP